MIKFKSDVYEKLSFAYSVIYGPNHTVVKDLRGKYRMGLGILAEYSHEQSFVWFKSIYMINKVLRSIMYGNPMTIDKILGKYSKHICGGCLS